MSILQHGCMLTMFLTATNVQAFVVIPLSRNPKIASNWCSFRWDHPTCQGWSLDAQNDDEEEEEEDLELSGDWRAFRAKMVMSEKESSSVEKEKEELTEEEENDEEEDLDGIGSVFSSPATTSTKATGNVWNLNGEQWAYDSGKVIEQGAVILGGVEQDFGFGLRQQYFHKVVILVLNHEATFTRGIILNRPSEYLLKDKDNDVQWRVWFGGDVQGLDSLTPEIVCLHSLQNTQVTELSTPVMKDIQWTSFENAKKLVKMGEAKHTDFWVFSGYAGWGPDQLMGELDRKSWYMCATDSQTLLKELAKQSAFADPRDAGLDTWELLMNMIGHDDKVEECQGDFDDLMVKEWARENLLTSVTAKKSPIDTTAKALSKIFQVFNLDESLEKMKIEDASKSTNKKSVVVKEGSLVRASSAERSPFLLKNQEFHNSLILVLSHEKDMTAGVILNLSASKGLDISIAENDSGKKRTITIPLRYGGAYTVKGQTSYLWLHAKDSLRDANVGAPINDDDDGKIYKCSQEQAIQAIEIGVAAPTDFLVVTGISCWTSGGMQTEVSEGLFEVVPTDYVDRVWSALQTQEVLNHTNIMKHLALIKEAWKAGGNSEDNQNETNIPVTDGIGEGFDEDDESLVHNSDVKVSKLSDDALRSWVATFLLGAPTLGA